mmetsp:Transcript_535/g.582  ORF Transcript_535/g.582 Transcript_535/m.582 type:complete len:91 (-) Transcript_535:614-886(-)
MPHLPLLLNVRELCVLQLLVFQDIIVNCSLLLDALVVLVDLPSLHFYLFLSLLALVVLHQQMLRLVQHAHLHSVVHLVIQLHILQLSDII